MKNIGFFMLFVAVVAIFATVSEAHPHANRRAARHAQSTSWNAPYYNTATGYAIPLVVPPTAHMQTRWSWGVSQDTMIPIYHQFRRPYSGDGGRFGGEQGLQGTPRWPSHTDQMGVFYIRGPW